MKAIQFKFPGLAQRDPKIAKGQTMKTRNPLAAPFLLALTLLCFLSPLAYADTASPDVVHNLPTPGSNLRPTISATITDSDSGIDWSTFRLKINGQDQSSVAVINSSTMTYTPNLDLSEGLHRTQITIKDIAGNQTIKEGVFVIDSTAPRIFVSPTNTLIAPKSRPKIIIQLYEGHQSSGPDMSQLSCHLDGQQITLTIEGNTASYIPNVDLSKTNHTLDITAKDLAGNTNSLQSQFTIDDQAPMISLKSPAPNTALPGPRPQVTVSYSDTGVIDPSSAILTLNGVNYSEYLTSSREQSTLKLPINHPGLDEESINAQFSISDFAGNSVTSNWTFTVDNSKPTITSSIANNSVSNNGTPTIQIDYSDALSAVNIDTLQIQIDNVDRSSEFTITANSATLDLADSEPLSEGNHSLTLSIQDGAGHIGHNQIFFKVDQSAPVLTVTPGDGLGIRRLRPILRVRLNEALANIDSTTMQLLVDGVDQSSEVVRSGQEYQFIPNADLSQGSHNLAFQVSDLAGNQATYSGTFITETSAQNLSLTLSPGQNSAIPINVSQNLTVTARTPSGLTVDDFTGVILLTCNDVSNPIHGQRLTFTANDRGVKTVPVTFQKAGPLQIDAIVESQGAILGSLQFHVTTQKVILYPVNPPNIASAAFTLHGSSFSSLPVDVYVDGQLNQQVTAAQDGSYSAALSLSAGTYKIYCQGISAGQTYTSETRTIEIQARPALISQLPSATNQSAFQLEVLALPNSAVRLIQGGVVTLTKNADANGVASFTLIYLANTSVHNVQFAMTVDGEELLSPVYSINLDFDKPDSLLIKSPLADHVSSDSSILVTGESPEAGQLYLQRGLDAPILAGSVNGSFEITVPLALQQGSNSVKFWFVDEAGNASLKVSRTVHFGADLLYGRIRYSNLAGQLFPLSGATILALDANGELSSDTSSAEGGFFTLSRGTTSTLKIVSEVPGLEELIYDVKAGENKLSIVLGLKRNHGVLLPLDAQSTTTASTTATTLEGGASITIPSGVRIQSNASPVLRIWRADPSALKTTFPGDTLLSALYKLAPHGTLSGVGATLKLPNVNNYKPGQGQVVYIFHDGADSAAPKDSNGVSSHLGHISSDGKHIVVEGLDAFSTIGINAQSAAQHYVVNGTLSLPTRPDSDLRLVLSNGQSMTIAPFQGQQSFNIPLSYLPSQPLNLRVETNILGFPVQIQTPTIITPNLFTDIDLGTITVGLELKNSSFASSATQIHSSTGTQSFQVVVIGDSLNQFSANSSHGLIPPAQNFPIIQTTPILAPLNPVVSEGFVLSGHVGPNQTLTIYCDQVAIADSAANAADFTFQDIVGTNQRVFVYTPPSSLFAQGQPLEPGNHTVKYRRALGVESSELQLTVVSPTPPSPSTPYTFDISAGTGFNNADPYFSVFEIEFNKAIKDDLLVDLDLASGYAVRLRRAADINSALGIRVKKISSTTIRVMVLERLEEETDYELVLGSGLKSIDDEVLPQNPGFPEFQFRTGLNNTQLEDSLGPQLTVLSPILGAGPQAASSPIQLRLEDTFGRALDLGSLSVEIHVDVLDSQGQIIARRIHYRGTYHSSFSYYGSARDAIVEIDPSGIIAPGSDVKIVVYASDIAGNSIRNLVAHPDASSHQDSYIFNYNVQSDSSDPVITLLEPANYLTHAQTALTPLRFQVTDDNAGVDLQRLKITIDGFHYSLAKQFEQLPNTLVEDSIAGTEAGALHFPFPIDTNAPSGTPQAGHYPRELPFVFPYHGKGIEKIRIYPHGYLDLATQFIDIPGSDEYPNQVELQNHPRLAPFWTKLKNVNIYTKLGTDSQGISFYDIRWDADTAPYAGISTAVSFAVRLFEDGRIALRYSDGLTANPGDDSHVLQGISGVNKDNLLVIGDKQQWSMETLELEITTTAEFKNVTEISDGYLIDVEPVIPLQSPISTLTVQAFDRNKPNANSTNESFSLNVTPHTSSSMSTPSFLSVRSGDLLNGPINISLIGLADPFATVIITGYRGESWRTVADSDGIFNYYTPELVPGVWNFGLTSFNAIGQVAPGVGVATVTIRKREKNPNDPDSSNSPLDTSTNLNQPAALYPSDTIKPDIFISHRNNWTWSGPTKSYSSRGYTIEQTRVSQHLLHSKPTLVRNHDKDDKYLTYFRVDRSPKLQTFQQNIVAYKDSLIRLRFATGTANLPILSLGRVRYQVIEPAGATFTNGLDKVELVNADYESDHNTLGPEFRFNGTEALLRVTDLDGHYSDESLRSREIRISPMTSSEENRRLFMPTTVPNASPTYGQLNQIQILRSDTHMTYEDINLPFQLLHVKSTSGPMKVIPPDIFHPNANRSNGYHHPQSGFLFSALVIPNEASTLTTTYPILNEFRPSGMGPLTVSQSFQATVAEFNNQISPSARFYKAILQTDSDGSKHYRCGNFTFGNLATPDYENQYFGERFLLASRVIPNNGHHYYPSLKGTVDWTANSYNNVVGGPLKKVDGTAWAQSLLQNDIPNSGLKFDIEEDALNPQNDSQFFFVARRRLADPSPPPNYTNVAFSTAMVALPDRAMNPSEIYVEKPKVHVKVSSVQKNISPSDAELTLTFQAHDQLLSFVPVDFIESDTVKLTIVGPNSVGEVIRSEFPDLPLSPIPLANQEINTWEREISLPNRHLSSGSHMLTVYPGRTKIHLHYTGVTQEESHAIYEVELKPNATGDLELTWVQVVEELFPEPLGAVFFQGIRHDDPFSNSSVPPATMSVTTPSGNRSVSLNRFYSTSHLLSKPFLPISPETAAKLPSSLLPATLNSWPILVIDESSTVSGTFENDNFTMQAGDSLYIRGWHNNQAQSDNLELYDSFKVYLRTDEENLGSTVDVFVSNYNYGGHNWITLTREGTSNTFVSEVLDLKDDPNLAKALNSEYGLSIKYQGLITGTVASQIKRTKISIGGAKKTSPYEVLSGASPKGGFKNTVELATGEFHYSLPILSIPQSSGPPLGVVFTYRSQIEYFNSPVAPNWDHNYNQRIRVAHDQSGDLEYFNGAGRVLRFKKQVSPPTGAPNWLPPEGFYGLIEKVGKDYQLVTKSGGILYFHHHGFSSYARLEKIEDSHGFAVSLSYGTHGLKRVTDRFGRSISFDYHSTTTDTDNLARINRIYDSTTRTVKIGQYNSTTAGPNKGLVGDLEFIRLPTTVQHPEGFAWAFRYSTEDDAPHDHNLIEIYDSLGTQIVDKSLPESQWTWSPIQNQALLVNQYGAHNSLKEDRVVQQRYGRPKLPANEDPGGTYDFDYTATTTEVTHPKGTQPVRTLETYTFDKLDGNGVLLPIPSKREVVDNHLNKTLVWTYQYNEDHNNTETVFPLGKKVESEYHRVKIFTPSIKPWALSRGNLTQVKTSPSGASSTTLVPTITTVYDSSSRDPRGTKNYNTVRYTKVTLNQTDEKRTDFTYNEFGDLKTSTTMVTAIEIYGFAGEETQTLTTTNEYYPASASKTHQFRLKSTTDPEGNITSYKYDNYGYLNEIESGHSLMNLPSQTSGLTYQTPIQKTKFEFDALGHKVKETSPRGVSTTFSVNAYGQVTVMLRASEVTQSKDHAHKYKSEYFYNKLGLLKQTITENSWPLQNKMPTPSAFNDGQYRHVPELHNSNKYDVLGRLIEIRKQVGGAPRNVRGKPIGGYATTRLEYNGAGQLVCKKSPLTQQHYGQYQQVNNSEGYEYNWRGQMITRYFGDSSARKSITRNVYNEHGLIKSSTSPAQITSTYLYDDLDRVESVNRGNSNLSSDPLRNNWQTTTFKHDIAGRVTETVISGKGGTGPDSILKKSTVAYDELSRPTIQNEFAISLASSENRTTRLRYNGNNQIVVKQDPRGKLTKYEYNTKNQMILRQFPINNPIVKTTWQRDHVNFQFSKETVVEFDVQGRQCADPKTTTSFFDEFRQVTKKMDPEGGTSFAVYNSRGQIVAEAGKRGPLVNSNDLKKGNKAGHVTFTMRNGVGKPVRIISLGGDINPTTLQSTGHGSFAMQSSAQIRQFLYDANGRLTSEWSSYRPNLSARENLTKRTDTYYDQQNRPIRREDIRTDGANWIYDNTRTTTVTAWDSGTGQLTSMTDSKGVTKSFTYDALGGMVKTVVTQSHLGSIPGVANSDKSTAGFSNVKMNQDGLGRVIKSEVVDPTLSVLGTRNGSPPVIRTEILYDGFDRAREERTYLDGQNIPSGGQPAHKSRTISVTYSDHSLATVQYSSPRTIGYFQDTYGRLKSISKAEGLGTSVNNTTQTRATFQWCGGTQLDSYTQNTGPNKTVKTEFKFTTTGQITDKIVKKQSGTGPATEIMNIRILRDRSGNIVRETKFHRNQTPSSQVTYSYDAFGNRSVKSNTEQNKPTAVPNSSSNTQSPVVRHSDGTILFDGRFFYINDGMNRLSQVWNTENKLVMSLHYDGLNRRAVKVSYKNGQVDKTYCYVYRGTELLEVYCKEAGSPEYLKTYYINGLGGAIEAHFFGAAATQLGTSTQKRLFIHRDLRNMPLLFTQNDNSIYQRNVLSPNGSVLFIEDEDFVAKKPDTEIPLDLYKDNFFIDREIQSLQDGRRGLLLTLFSAVHGLFRDNNPALFELLGPARSAIANFDNSNRYLDKYSDHIRNGWAAVADGGVSAISFGIYEGHFYANLMGADPNSMVYKASRLYTEVIGSAIYAAVIPGNFAAVGEAIGASVQLYRAVKSGGIPHRGAAIVGIIGAVSGLKGMRRTVGQSTRAAKNSRSLSGSATKGAADNPCMYCSVLHAAKENYPKHIADQISIEDLEAGVGRIRNAFGKQGLQTAMQKHLGHEIHWSEFFMAPGKGVGDGATFYEVGLALELRLKTLVNEGFSGARIAAGKYVSPSSTQSWDFLPQKLNKLDPTKTHVFEGRYNKISQYLFGEGDINSHAVNAYINNKKLSLFDPQTQARNSTRAARWIYSEMRIHELPVLVGG